MSAITPLSSTTAATLWLGTIEELDSPSTATVALENGPKLQARLTQAAQDARLGATALVLGSGTRWFVVGLLGSEGDALPTFVAIEREANRNVLLLPEGDLEIGVRGTLSVRAQRAELVAELVRCTLGTIETEAEEIIERAQRTLREAQDLALQRAGRLRTVVERAASLLAERFVVQAESDVKIDGARIHLG